MNQLEEIQLSIALDWRSDFEKFLQTNGVAASSIKSYQQDIKHFAAWFQTVNGQEFEPALITGVDLRSYRSQALHDRVAPTTFNRRRACLRRLVAWAIDCGLLNYDPFQGIDPIAQVEPSPRWLSEAEYRKLMRQVELTVNGARSEYARWQSIRDQAIVVLMLHAGLREAEVCSLDWSDLLIGERKGKVIVYWGKGPKKRVVPLSNEARRAVQLWQKTGSREAGAVFAGKGGERIGVKLVQNRVRALRTAAGLDRDVTPHALRHTFAKRLLDAGTPLTVVSKLLGHSRTDTTARYVQPSWEDFEKAVEKL